MQNQINWKKYLLVLAITALIFITAIYVSNYFGNKRIEDLKTIQSQLSIDILSSETEFSLLENASCKDIATTTALSEELSNLSDKLNYEESQRGATDSEVIALKQNYSLLEIKDYLLMKQIAVKCHTTPVFVLYFYSNQPGACTDCQKEGYVLTQLREDYPDVRVYSFDYDLDLGAVKTLVSINKIKGTQLPVLVIGDDTYYGFQALDTLEKLPDMKTLVQAKLATSTKVK